MIQVRELKDLQNLYEDTKYKILNGKTKLTNDVSLPEGFKKGFSKELPDSIQFNNNTAVLTTAKGLQIYIANQWFYLASLTSNYCSELFYYKKLLYEVFDDYDERLSAKKKQELIQEAKNKNESELKSIINKTNFQCVNQNQSAGDIQSLLIKFASDESYSHAGKTIDRGDFFYSPILNLANVVAVSSNYIAELSAFLVSHPDLNKLLQLFFDELPAVTVRDLNLKLEYKNYLQNISTIVHTPQEIECCIQFIDVPELKKLEAFDWNTNIYSIDNVDEVDVEIEKIRSCSNFEEINQNSNYFMDSSLNLYRDFIEWRNQKLKVINKPHQRIFFGAPGTGKSYQLNKDAVEYFGDNFERITFHPDYMYGNFVGSYKPYPEVLKVKDENGNKVKRITYEYVAGPFINQLIKAFAYPEKNFLVLIEEINRANVAAVFGDMFQLLDRSKNGDSEYNIVNSRELRDYLSSHELLANLSEVNPEASKKLGNNFERLYLPKNFYIWATMNSADQGVMPMDTAFKRRWEFTYLGIDEAANKNLEQFNQYEFLSSSTTKVKWNDYRRAVNSILANVNIPEDKLLGPYFVSESVLSSADLERKTKVIKEKVLMYLYEDAARPFRKEVFAENKYTTYSKLCEAFDEDATGIFKTKINIRTEIIHMEKTIQGLNNYEEIDSGIQDGQFVAEGDITVNDFNKDLI